MDEKRVMELFVGPFKYDVKAEKVRDANGVTIAELWAWPIPFRDINIEGERDTLGQIIAERMTEYWKEKG